MTEKEEIAQRLVEEAIAKYGSQQGLNDKINRSAQFMNVYYSGINSPGPKISKLLQEAGIDVAYVKTGRRAGESPGTKKVIPNSMLRPVYASIPAGKGSISKAHSYLEAPPDVKDEGKGYWIKVKGDSMTPRFNDGDMIFVNPVLEVHSGDIAVVYWNDHQDGAIKKVHLEKNNAVLTSLNSNHPPIIVPLKSISAMARISYIKL